MGGASTTLLSSLPLIASVVALAFASLPLPSLPLTPLIRSLSPFSRVPCPFYPPSRPPPHFQPSFNSRSFRYYSTTMAKGTTKGGVKKAKDPNAPKRAMSAFFFWMAENRDKLKKPGMGVADVAKAAGVEWGKLGDKSKWEKLAEKDKKRYETEITAYKGQ